MTYEVKLPVWYNNICTEHSCIQAMPYPLLNVCDLYVAEIFILEPKLQEGGQLRGPLLLLQFSLHGVLFARDLCSVYSIQQLLTNHMSSDVKNWPGPQLYLLPGMQWSSLYIWLMKWSSQYGTTTYALNILVSRPCIIRYSMFVTFMLLKSCFEPKQQEGGQLSGPLFTVSILSVWGPFCTVYWNYWPTKRAVV